MVSEIKEKVGFREGNISLILDSYDDLFSDFDPRPYSVKGISDDFLSECKRAVRDRSGIMELRLSVSHDKRKIQEEYIIKKRLKEHFKKHFKREKDKISSIKKEGLWWFFIGSIILSISTFLYEFKGDIYLKYKYIFDFLFIISQPSGWFTLWEGLGKIFIHSKDKSEEFLFYKKMTSLEIHFISY